MATLNTGRNRVLSIDILRGIVMIIMALDHTRELLHDAANGRVDELTGDPLNLATTTPVLFFTRWVTHFCAPVFIFLSGMSAWFMSLKKTRKELGIFLVKRGVWLVIAELVIVSFGITFNPSYPLFILQVIWATGIGMILLGLAIQFPFKTVFTAGIVIVAGHNLLDIAEINTALKGGFAADLLYFSQFSAYSLNSGHSVVIIYSFIPWAGVMMLGYCFGKFFTSFTVTAKRKQALVSTGLLLVLLFVVLRLLNIYGDPVPWQNQEEPVFTLLSFINVNKYPPSLAYLCITIGPSLILLGLAENIKNNSFARFVNTFGRVPFFYYVLHFYLLHFIMIIVFYASGYGYDDITQPGNPFFFKPTGFGVPLAGVYLIWVLAVLLLYPLCKRYNEYKNAGRQWWLSYI